MEVMRKCLYAPLTTPLVKWTPPNGHTITSIIPSKLYSPLYGGSAQSMFALLKKTEVFLDEEETMPPLVAISGTLEGEAIEITTISHVIQATPYDDITALVLRVAAWRKLSSLHNQLLQPPPKPHPSQPDSTESDSPPPTKKSKLNGHRLDPSHGMALEDLVSISLSAKIPCFPYTVFVSSGDGLPIIPVLPWNGAMATNNTSVSTNSEILSVKVPLRKRTKHERVSTSSSLSSGTFSSLAKKTVAKCSEAVKSVVSIASIGLMDMDVTPTLNGEGLEDQEYYNDEKNRIHWNYNNELVVPSCYYATATPPAANTHRERPESSRRESDDDSMCEEIYMDCNDLAQSSRLYSQSAPPLSYSSTASNTSDALPLRPSYTSIIELQLPEGAWSLVPSIALATGVPMVQILELPLPNGCASKGHPAGDGKGHFWATVLVLACLELHFAHFKTEWIMLARKAENWLHTQQTAVPMSLVDAQDTARRLMAAKHHQ